MRTRKKETEVDKRTNEDQGKYKPEIIEGRALTTEERERIANNFRYHAPFGIQSVKYEFIRGEARTLAETFCHACPPSRELSLALTRLEEAVMWANAAIARNEKNDPNA
jgi:hypothetical protein